MTKKAKAKKRKRVVHPNAHGVRAVVRMNKEFARQRTPVLVPIAVMHDPVKGPVVVVPKDVPVKQVMRQTWVDFLFGTSKQ